MTRTEAVRHNSSRAAPPIAPATAIESGVQERPLPLMFHIVFLSLVIPVFFSIGSLYMSLSRSVLLVLTPILMFQLLAGKFGRLRVTDILMFLFMFWFSLSIFINNRSAFVTFVGSNMLILLGGYLVGRCYIGGPRSFRQMIIFYGAVVVATLPFALQEAATSQMVIARIIDKIPLVSSSNDVNYEPRMGIHRVQVVFTHPIHYGLFCSICFSLVMIGLRESISFSKRWLWTVAIGLSCFLSLSSGPVLGMMFQIMLIGYSWLTRGMASRWITLMSVSAVLYVILEIFSNRPAYYAIIERLAFNSSTAFVRRILLDYGLAQIGRTPVFGVGYNSWDLPAYMTGSLDNYWLMTALVYGIPAFAFLFGAYLYTIIMAGKAELKGDTTLENFRLGWMISSVGLIFTLTTVAVWSDMATLTFMFIGSGVWLIGARARSSVAETEISSTKATSTGPRFSRFLVNQSGTVSNQNSRLNLYRRHRE